MARTLDGRVPTTATADGAVTEHHIHRHADEHGWRATCTCGYSVTRRSRQLRDADSNAHTTEHIADRITAAITWTNIHLSEGD